MHIGSVQAALDGDDRMLISLSEEKCVKIICDCVRVDVRVDIRTGVLVVKSVNMGDVNIIASRDFDAFVVVRF